MKPTKSYQTKQTTHASRTQHNSGSFQPIRWPNAWQWLEQMIKGYNGVLWLEENIPRGKWELTNQSPSCTHNINQANQTIRSTEWDSKWMMQLYIWGLWRKNQVFRAQMINYIQRILWDVITYPCPRYLIFAHKSSVGLYGYKGK